MRKISVSTGPGFGLLFRIQFENLVAHPYTSAPLETGLKFSFLI